MSSDQIRCISHSVAPLTPPIPARWEDKKGTELLKHLYAIHINGELDDDTKEKLARLKAQVKDRKRVDVTEEQLRQLDEEVTNKELISKMKRLADDLYTKVIKKEWAAVIKIYKEQKKEMIQMAWITPSKHTALHIAILTSQIDAVKELLENIDPVTIREMTDYRDENPLHLAASLEQLETCQRLVEKDQELIGAKNVVGETPLFLAVLHGKKEAFYALHPKCPITGKNIKHTKACCKRNDGNTILHLSIRGEYFELAYQIIHWYPELINDFNNDGQTALHLLAQNPSTFRSGCYLGPVDYLIYSWFIDDSDKVVDSDKVERPFDSTGEHCVDIAGPVPQNYQTCLDLLNLGKRVFKLTVPGERQETSNRDPIQDEMSHDSCKHCPREHIGDKREPQMGPREKEGSDDSTPQEEHGRVESPTPQRASQMAKEDLTAERPQYPSNYHVFLHFLQLAIELFLFVAGLGYFQVGKIKAMRQKHKLTSQIMKKLVQNTNLWVHGAGGTGSRPDTNSAAVSTLPLHVESVDDSTEAILDQDEIRQDVSASTSKNAPVSDGLEEKYISPILVAAKNGVVEIVMEILSKYSLAIYEEDADQKNMLMLAVENRQTDIYNILRQEHSHQSFLFQKSDKDGNSAIHLVATTGSNRPWPVPGAALQLQWELKWYEFVRETMPHNIFRTYQNKERRTPTEVFNEAHKTMLEEGVKWLTNTAQSCSVVAALVATVAYASATTVPGGVEKGIPLLRNTYAFSIFTIASLVALCLSVTSLTMFLSILTSRNEVSDFHHNLPMKLILGLSSLFISIAAMLVSFCAGHFFDLADQLQHTAFPIYAVTCLPVSIYAVTQFPLYFDLLKSIFMTVPKRNN